MVSEMDERLRKVYLETQQDMPDEAKVYYIARLCKIWGVNEHIKEKTEDWLKKVAFEMGFAFIPEDREWLVRTLEILLRDIKAVSEGKVEASEVM